MPESTLPYKINLSEIIAFMRREGIDSEFSREVFLRILTELPTVPHVPGLEVLMNLASKVVPNSIDFLIVQGGKFLMTWREDQFYRGWHFPGGYRIPRTSLSMNAQVIISRELHGCLVTGMESVCTVDHENDPRTHHVATLYLTTLSGPTPGDLGGSSEDRAKWFSEIPSDVIPIHAAYRPHVVRILEHIERCESLV